MRDDGEAFVRLSSKGQLVLPANIRRRLGLVTGRVLRLNTRGDGQLTLTPLGEGVASVEQMLMRTRSAAKRGARDLVEELHARRAADRRREERRRANRGD